MFSHRSIGPPSDRRTTAQDDQTNNSLATRSRLALLAAVCAGWALGGASRAADS
jgi:hypothetical protein